jgi:hypothetical protein
MQSRWSLNTVLAGCQGRMRPRWTGSAEAALLQNSIMQHVHLHGGILLPSVYVYIRS